TPARPVGPSLSTTPGTAVASPSARAAARRCRVWSGVSPAWIGAAPDGAEGCAAGCAPAGVLGVVGGPPAAVSARATTAVTAAGADGGAHHEQAASPGAATTGGDDPVHVDGADGRRPDRLIENVMHCYS